MSATILDGRALSKTIGEEIEAEAAAFVAQHGVKPALAVVRAGEDPASVSYAGALEKSFGKRGLGFSLHCQPETVGQDQIMGLVRSLNEDRDVRRVPARMYRSKSFWKIAV
jgi:methylenetetrahydrofolate dehydrogenase (NADP+)/methenyltetrahydrofolate cyclohydrolase